MAKSKKPVHSRNMAKNKETRPYTNMAKNDTQTVSRLYSKEQRECVLEKILVKL